MIATGFGPLLRTYRTRAGLSQEQLAERAGVSASGVGALEQGLRRAPYRETIERLSRALDLDDRDRTQLYAAADAARCRAPRSPRPPMRLPTPGTSFVERAEVDEIAQLLARSRLVTITGAGGIGKTRTALEAARRLAEAGTDCRYADLSAVTDEAGMWSAIAAACEISGIGAEPAAAVCENLASRRLILVLDNCEHIVDAAANAVQDLLAKASSLRLLVTSRERLGLMSELVFRLPSMETPTALRLLIARAEASDAHAHEALGDVDLLIEICRLLEGIPLAIELAAFHLPPLGAAAVRDRLSAGLALLGPRDLPQRHQTMRAAIAWSFDLLDLEERGMMEDLGVFAGGFTLAAAQQVCAGARLSAQDIADALVRLVKKSLVQVEQREGSPRYVLLETVRAFALEQLAMKGTAEDANRRHLRWLEETALALSRAGPGRNFAALYAEMENIRAALRWATTSASERDIIAAGTIVGHLRLLWFTFGRNVELQMWVERILPRLREPDHTAVLAYLCAALLNCGHPDPDEFVRLGERTTRLLRQCDDLGLAATLGGSTAMRLADMGRDADAERFLALASPWVESDAAQGQFQQLTFLHNRAGARKRVRRFDEARRDLERIIELADDRNDPDGLVRAMSMVMLADIFAETGDPNGAVALCSDAVERFAPLDGLPTPWVAVAYTDLASFHLALERPAEVKRCALLAFDAMRRRDYEWYYIFLILACVFAREGAYAIAALSLGFAENWFRQIGTTIENADRTIHDETVRTLEMHAEDELRSRRLEASKLSLHEIAALVERACISTKNAHD